MYNICIQYAIYIYIGEGAFELIYRARNKYTQRLVVVKLRSFDNNKQLTAINECLMRLKRSESTDNKYCKHIVSYKSSFMNEEKYVWIIMEYCAVGSVFDIMRLSGSPLHEKQIQIIMNHCLKGLKYLDDKQLQCDNFQASKVYITKKGECKIDLITMDRNAWLNNCISYIDSPYWKSPEQLTEQKNNVKTLIWSLGITAIEMATGKPPHADMKPLQALFVIPASAPPLLPMNNDEFEWSDGFRDFVRLCTIKNPDHRAGVTELLEHEWITNAECDGSELMNLIEIVMPLVEEYRREFKRKEMEENDADHDIMSN